MLLLMTMILWIKLYCKNITPSMVTMQKLERHCRDKKCRKSKVQGVEEEGTLVSGILVVAVAILDQDQEATLGGDLMDMEVDVDLGMAIMGMEEDLEVAILEVALVMEEEEEDMVVEDLDMATRVGATEVVMTTMEEGIMEVEIIMILEIITSNLLTMAQ